jgi:acyl carrier protein
MDVQSILKDYIVTEFLHERDNAVLKDDAPLIESGIIDSMGLIRLILFIEEKFGIKIGEEELDMENFRTIGALTEFVTEKIQSTK